jgi:hypothetical protein
MRSGPIEGNPATDKRVLSVATYEQLKLSLPGWCASPTPWDPNSRGSWLSPIFGGCAVFLDPPLGFYS